MTIAETIKHLQGYPPETPCAYGLWLPEDVKALTKKHKIRITKAQIAEVLEQVHYKHDANDGINWLNILFWIRETV